MTSTSRQSIATLATDLQEVLAWGESTESANSALREMLELERSTVLQQVATIAAKGAEVQNLLADREHDAEIIEDQVATIAAKDAEIGSLTALLELARQVAEIDRIARNQLVDEIERLEAELALYRPAFVWGDATRQQFLGAPFTEPFPICYESEFYPSSVAPENRKNATIDYWFALDDTMPDWRARYPNAPRWISDIEWLNSGGITAAEVAKILPGFQAAREFAAAEGRGLKLGGYGLPPRFGTHMTDAEVMAQADIIRPILDLLDECILTLYPIYTDLEQSRTYIRRNIELGRAAMPGKKVFVLGWPVWHPNVGAPLAGTPVSVEWWRMLIEESRANADGFAVWLKAATPKPTNEPWWLETLARAAA
jgi:hypothetical protein